jgi:hypothetical protein
VNAKPAGKTKLSEWIKDQASTLGLDYQNELARRRRRQLSYGLGHRPGLLAARR